MAATYCFSDLHGQYNLWTQIRDYIKPEDMVYCLGDCVDRGDDGLKILNEILATPNITLLRGNHEDFIIQIGKDIIDLSIEEQIDLSKDWKGIWKCSNLHLWIANGGTATIEDYCKLTIEQQKSLIDTLKKLPTYLKILNSKKETIHLCHAGLSPNYKRKIIPIDKWRHSTILIDDYLWDRNHILHKHWNGKENEFCVHGHTPISSMYYFLNDNVDIPSSDYEIFRYCDGHKIDIDLGSCETHTACLLNLDTWEPIYFEDPSFIKEIQEDKLKNVI